MSPWWIVFTKELRETVRDRRTLLMMVVVPVLLYPVLLIASEQILLFGQRRLASAAAPVAILGDAPPELLSLVDSARTLRLIHITRPPDEALRADTVAAVVVLGPRVEGEATRAVSLLYDATSDRSLRGRRELSGVLDAWRDTLLARRLAARGLPGSFSRPVAVADSSIALPEEVGGYTLGRILPLLLVVITLLGAFYPAIDLAAGEKERGTLETLLTAPVPPGAVVAGKFATVALIGIVAAALNLGSMLLTFQTGVLQVASQIGLDVSLRWTSVVVIFVTLVPLAVLFGALFLGIAVRSSSFKEAQNALTPVYMLVLIPAMLPLFPGIDFTPLMAVVPVAGVSFFFRDLMGGDARLVTGSLVLASTAVYAVAALVFAARAFGSEAVLFGGDDDRAEVNPDAGRWWTALARRMRPGRTPDPQAAVLFVAGVAVLFFWLGITLQVHWGERGLLASEWLLLFVPALVFVRLGGFDPRATLSLRRPSGAGVAGALLLVAGAMPVAWGIGWVQTFFLPIPWEILQGLEKLVTAETPGRLAWLILLLAVTPALCEEAVFRGVLLGGTRGLAPWRIVVLNGIVFGAFHLSFETAIRFLPTAWLGIVISWAVLRTGSIWVGSLMHLLNNGTIVLLASIPALQALFSDPDAPPPLWALPLAAAALYAGVRILAALPGTGDAVQPLIPSEDP
ncbi:MAG TPA: ABC transporter permease subunit/CPBP intramembrane protease [Longimicrobiales bacterium]|nr:ABC transporter permease subunit/CPBP intramembrane protease [Longimicrobiales bacterium]